MTAMWLSFKGCGSKVSDVARPTARTKTSSIVYNEQTDKEKQNPLNTNRFHELGTGDPSRNVIEMIIQTSSANPKRRSKKIKRVLKVNNSADIVAKFEKYREKVMNEQQQQWHPRSIVDGNELLQFYGTTMSCCSSGDKVGVLSEACGDGGCRVCRIIQSGFNTSYHKVHGIRVSSKSRSMSEDVVAKKAKRAVIICRTIAGGVQVVGDSMIVRNPNALLPCFVVVFDSR